MTQPESEFTVSTDGDIRAGPSLAPFVCRGLPVQAVSLHVRTSIRPLELLR